MNKTFTFFLAFLFFSLIAKSQFTPNNVAVLRIGDGTTPLASTSAKVDLLEFTPGSANQTSPVQTISVGSTSSGSRLTLVGTSKQEGQLSLSKDNRFLCLIGYDQPLGTASATCTAGSKVIARINNSGTVEYSTSFTTSDDKTQNVVSLNGNNFWANIGDESTQYLSFNSTTTTGTSFASSARTIGIFKNQLYGLLNYGNLLHSDPALPTSIGSTSNVIFDPHLDNLGFVFLDMDNTISWNSTGYDVLYIGNCNGGLAKYYWNGSAWTSAGTSNQAPYNISGLTAILNNLGQPVIYAISGGGTTTNNALLSITDNTGRTGDISSGLSTITLATAGENYAFRGVSLTPVIVPDAPTNIVATAGNGQATVDFTAPSNNGGATITSYTATSNPGNISATINQAGSGSITVTGLTSGTAYTFTVTATNANGTSGPSAASNSVTPTGVPEPPTGITASAGNGQATITFTAPANNGGSVITSYTATSNPGNISATLNQAGSGSITVTGLTNGTAYTFTVTATSSNGTSAASAASNSVTPSLVADQLTQGNLVVLRVGDGSTALSASSAKVDLLEYTPSTENQSAPQKIKTLGSVTSGSRLTLGGLSKQEGQLSLSADNRYICLIGYDQPLAQTSTTCTAGNKVIARMSLSGNIEYSTSFATPDGKVQNVASTNGINFWSNIGGESVQYLTFNSTSVTGTNFASSARTIGIFKNQLYGLLNYGNLLSSDPALPTASGAASTPIFDPHLDNIGFAFLDIDNTVNWNSTGYDVLYIGNCAGGLSKYYWNGTAWTSAGSSNQAPYNISGLTATINQSGQPVIYAISGGGTNTNNSLLAITDNTGLTGSISGGLPTVILATSGNNYAFRGVSITPVALPDPPSNISATAGNGQATVAFTAPSNNGGATITSYTATSNPGNISATINQSGSGSITLTGLTNGITYTFSITATNANGTSAASVASNSVTPSGAPEPPTGITASAGNGQATINFTAPANNGGAAITSYTATSNPGSISATINQSGSGSITVTGLTNGTAYTFTVTATNANGTSAASTASNSVSPSIYSQTRLTPGNLAVIRVGDGSTALTTSNTKVDLLEYLPNSSGQTSPVKTNEFGSLTSGTRLTLGGTSKQEGQLSLSADGRYLCIIGYDQPIGEVTATSTAGNKVIGRVNYTGIVEYSPSFSTTDGKAQNVVSTDGNSLWANIGGESVQYLTFSTPSVTGTSFASSSRTIGIFKNQLYGLLNYGNLLYSNPALPTSAGSTSNIIFDPHLDNLGFVFLDMDNAVNWNSTGYDVLYIGNCNGGLAKYYWDGTTWTSAGTSNQTPYNISGLTATLNNGQPVIFGISGGGTTTNNSLVAITDNTGRTGDISAGLSTVVLASAGTNYAFRGVAFTPIAVPDAPSITSVTAGNGEATINYTAPANNGGSIITSYTVTSNPGNISATVNQAASGAITVTGLTNGTSYTFTVVATNNAGASMPSIASAAITPSTVPDAPTSITATAGNGQATVNFTAPVNNGGSAITSYTATSNPGNITATVNQAGSGSVTVTGLTNGTAYTFTVVASNANGSSAASTASAAVTPSTVPDAPTNVTATAGNGQAVVNFTAPVNNGGSAITSYTATSNPGNITTTVNQAGSGTVTVTGLTNGTAYTFTVVATNANGAGAASTASAAVTPSTVPDAPTNVTATAGNGQAVVNFTAPASNGGSAITSYTATSNPGNITATVNQAGSGTVTVTGLTNGTAYTFTVKATNANGAGAASNASSAVTPSTVPDAPTNVTATAGNGQAVVNFTAPVNNGGSAITSYTATSNPGNITATVNQAGSGTVTVTGLTNGTAYTFTVVATNANGAGAASTASAAVTPSIPSAIKNLDGEEIKIFVSKGGIVVQNANNENYKIANISGILLGEGRIESDNHFIPLNTNGIIIFQINRQAIKLMISR